MKISPSWKILCATAFLLSCPTYVSSQFPLDPDYPGPGRNPHGHKYTLYEDYPFLKCRRDRYGQCRFNHNHPMYNLTVQTHSTANIITLWVKDVNTNIVQNHTFRFEDGSSIRSIFDRVVIIDDDNTNVVGYACGLYCKGTCDSFLFAIAIFPIVNSSFFRTPEVVWSANRNNPVGKNASIELTNGGDLVLRGADSTLVWSTGTSGKAVAGLNFTNMGNLVLFDANNSVVWQSVDHPTDCLLYGQHLQIGQNLTAAASPNDWSAGLFSLSVTRHGLVASVLSHPPQVYNKIFNQDIHGNSYVELQNGSLQWLMSLGWSEMNYYRLVIKLDDDGHLRVYEMNDSWKELADLFINDLGDCAYPMVCGKYGICTNGQCSCPGSRFRLTKDRLPDLGCSEVVPLACNASEEHSFMDLNNATYFNLFDKSYTVVDVNNTDMESCKEACLRNCSCKAAMFVFLTNSSNGSCYLPTEIFSLMTNQMGVTRYNSSVSLKIQIAAPAVKTSSIDLLWPMLGSALGIIVVIGTALFVCRRRKRKNKDAQEDYLDHVPGMPTRFSFQELAAATHNFSNKLGEGGFGSVYEGSLSDGTKIAVKQLGGVGHINKSFLAEVESIGSIHHINLVRLIGFCAEKFHRLLVYEYMCNGSLEKSIYSGRHETPLDWNKRRKIILDVAKGLAYLHDDCRKKILHLDIKPQNILLDEHYNAKLADFGLSKLIDRNQSQVVTTMRGTPGYLAPEWLKAIITDKVDVYSFGVVVLEILTGRKIFERSRPEEERYLLSHFKKKAEEGEWLNLVDECCREEGCDVAEVEKMMKISAWCIQSDHGNRPSMSMVIKVMEGATDVLKDIDYNSLISTTFEASNCEDASRLLPSLLSGPR